MRIAGVHRANCTFDVLNFGRRDIVITALGYGFSAIGNVGEARSKRTYYPYITTSGLWYVEAVFPDVKSRDALHNWLANYYRRITDPYQSKVLAPITVTVPVRDFMRQGYPTSSLAYGDAIGTAVYRSVIQFTSATNPLGNGASRYAPPTRDPEALRFYPPAFEELWLPPPGAPVIGKERVWRS